MTKGRPRDPTRAKRRTGHRRKPDEAPVLAEVVPVLPFAEPGFAAPADLPEEMRETWDHIVEAIGDVTTLRAGDALMVEAIVRQVHRMREAGRLVDEYGMMNRQASSGNVVVSPFVRAERDATAMLLRVAEQYGLTVAARLRLGLMQLAGQTLAQALAEDLDG